MESTKQPMKAIYFGDSIMAQDGKAYGYGSAQYNLDHLGLICRGYPTLLKERLGIENLGNYAVGGHDIRAQRDVMLNTDISGADLIVIAVGVNDFSSGTPIGKLPMSFDRNHDETFIGRYCAALDSIFTRNPLVKVALVTPLHRDTMKRINPGPKNAIDVRVGGNVLLDFVQAIRDVGQFYACSVVDLYAESGLNRFNLPLLTFEGVHPTNVGYEFLFPVFERKLSSL